MLDGATVVEPTTVVVAGVVVVVVESTIDVPNRAISRVNHLARSRYAGTVMCTPSATNRMILPGVKYVFQSATTRFGHRDVAASSARLKRTARAAQSARAVTEYSTFTQRTGRPPALAMTWLMRTGG